LASFFISNLLHTYINAIHIVCVHYKILFEFSEVTQLCDITLR